MNFKKKKQKIVGLLSFILFFTLSICIANFNMPVSRAVVAGDPIYLDMTASSASSWDTPVGTAVGSATKFTLDSMGYNATATTNTMYMTIPGSGSLVMTYNKMSGASVNCWSTTTNSTCNTNNLEFGFKVPCATTVKMLLASSSSLKSTIGTSFSGGTGVTGSAISSPSGTTHIISGVSVGCNNGIYIEASCTTAGEYTFSLLAGQAVGNVKLGIVAVEFSHPYKVTYNNNGHGATPTNLTGQSALPSPLPTLIEDGWTFGGWFTDSELQTPAVAGATLSADATLYAKWTENASTGYSITFEENGHGASQTDLTGQTALPNPLPTLSTTGWTFGGWFTDIGLETPAVAGATLSANATLFAKWTANTYSVTLNENGGSYIGAYAEPTSYTYGTGLTLPTGAQIEKSGYTFLGWTETNSESDVSYVSSISTSATGDKVYYAKWSENAPTTYTVDLYEDEGTYYNGYVEPTSYTFGVGLTLPTASQIQRAGYTFLGWTALSDDYNETTNPYILSISSSDTGNKTFYAKWTENVSYSVSFNSNGGTAVTQITGLASGATISEPTEPTKDYYTFSGWFKDDGTFLQAFDFANETITSSITLFAKWTANTYSVTLNENSGSYIGAYVEPTSYTYGVGLTLPTASEIERTGYTFNGWTASNDVSDVSYILSITSSDNGNKTFYAKWTENAIDYTVTFNSNDGTSVPSQTVQGGQTATQPTAPTKANYIFGGWFMDNGTFLVEFSFSTAITGDITLFAKWNVEPDCARSFDLDDICPNTGDVYLAGTSSAAGTERACTLYEGATNPLSGTFTSTGDYSAFNDYYITTTQLKFTKANLRFYTASTIRFYLKDATSITFYKGTKSTGNYRLELPDGTYASDGTLTWGSTTSYTYSNGGATLASGYYTLHVSSNYYLNAVQIVRASEQFNVSYLAGDYTVSSGTLPASETITGSSYTISSTIPVETSGNYLFSHWTSGGVSYSPSQSISLSANLTLTANWKIAIKRVQVVENVRINATDAQSGLGLPSTVLVYYTTAGTERSTSVGVNWNTSSISSASYAVGTYTVVGTLNSAPTGYAYVSSLLTDGVCQISTSVELYALSGVTASAGWTAQNVLASSDWHGGNSLTSGDYYSLDVNGEVSLEAIETNAYINSSAKSFVGINAFAYNSTTTATNLANAGVKITVKSGSSGTISARVCHYQASDAGFIYLLDSTGTRLGSVNLASTTTGALTTETMSVVNASFNYSSANGNEFYILAETTRCYVYSLVVSSNYEVEQADTYSVSYNVGTGVTGSVSDSHSYLANAKVVLKSSSGLSKPTYRWTNWNVNSVSYGEEDFFAISENTTVYAVWQAIPTFSVTFVRNTPNAINEQPITESVYENTALSSNQIPTMADIYVDGELAYVFDGWFFNSAYTGNQFDTTSTITENIVVYGKWNYVGVSDVYILVSNFTQTGISVGTSSADLIAILPKTLVVSSDVSGKPLSNVSVSVLSWTKPANYNPQDFETAFIFTGVLGTPPDGYVFDSTQPMSGENYIVTCSVTLQSVGTSATYVAEYSAYSYDTQSNGTLVYNNDSNSYGVSWETLYTNSLANGNVVFARNGELTISADKSNGASADIAHAKTAPMVKGSAGSSGMISIVVPNEITYVKITVYAVRYRKEKKNEAPSIVTLTNPVGDTVNSDPITAHTFTEGDGGTEYDYFYPFSPNSFTYEYYGNGTFTIGALDRNGGVACANVYITGVKVECSAPVSSRYATITYNANNQTNASYSVNYLENTDQGNCEGVEAIIDKNTFSYEGHEFAGWATSASASPDTNYSAGKSINLSDGQNLQLYAVWSNSLFITYNKNDGSVNPETFVSYYSNGDAVISENTFERNGYVFVGWCTESVPSQTSISYSPGDFLKITSNKTLYAQWASGSEIEANFSAYSSSIISDEMIYNNASNTWNNAWTSKYNADGTLARFGDLTVTTNATAGASAQTKPTIMLDSSADHITVSIPYSGYVSITVYASVMSGFNSNLTWTGGYTDAVSLDVNGDYVASETAFNPFRPNIITHSYTAEGSSASPYVITISTSSANACYVSGISVSCVTTISESDSQSTTTYHSNDGTDRTWSENILNGLGVVGINNYARDGYTFSGWSTSASGTVEYAYGTKLSSMPSNLYAVWTPIEYDFSYGVYGADGQLTTTLTPNKVTVETNISSSILSSVTQQITVDGIIYALDGWYADSNCSVTKKISWSTENTFNITMAMVNANGGVCIYAKYVEVSTAKKEVAIATTDAQYGNGTVQVIFQKTDELADILALLGNETMVSTSVLELPINKIATNTTDSTDYITVDVSWDLTTATVAGLTSGQKIYYGTARIRDDQFAQYCFNGGLQICQVRALVTLSNRIIYFENGVYTPQSTYYFSTSASLSDVRSTLASAIQGYYWYQNASNETVSANITIGDSTWVSAPSYDPLTEQHYSFSTLAQAPKGYVFAEYNASQELLQTTVASINVSVNVELLAEYDATIGVGFQNTIGTAWRNERDGENFTIDTLNSASSTLTITAIDSDNDETDLDETNFNTISMIKINSRKNGVSIYVPSGLTSVKITLQACLPRLSSTGTVMISGIPTAQEGTETTTYSFASLANTSAGIYSPETLALSEVMSYTVTTYGKELLLTLSSTNADVFISKLVAQGQSVKAVTTDSVNVVYNYQPSSKTANDSLSPYLKSSKVVIEDIDPSWVGEGYVFRGWSLSALSNVVTYNAGDVVDLSANLNLHAVIELNSWVVTLYKNDGSADVLEILVRKTVGNSLQNVLNSDASAKAQYDAFIVRVGYNFTNWNYSSSGSGLNYAISDAITNNVSIYAKWVEDSYTVNYSIDGSAFCEPKTVVYGNKLFEPNTINTTKTVTINGKQQVYTFYGWYADAGLTSRWNFTNDFTVENYPNLTASTESITLYGAWGATVTFNTQPEGEVGTSSPESFSVVVKLGETITLDATYNVTLQGYTFAGWTLEGTLVETITPQYNIELKATWTANDVTVTFTSQTMPFIYNDVSGTSFQITYENGYGSSIATPSFSANNYVLMGWYRDSELTNRWVFSDDTGDYENSRINSENLILYAKWGVNVSFDVFNETDLGTELSVEPWYPAIVVAIGDKIPFVSTVGEPTASGQIHATPTIPGYEFVAWYKTIQGGLLDENKFATSTPLSTANIASLNYSSTNATVTIYAVFSTSDRQVSITFNANGVTGVTMPSAITGITINEQVSITATATIPETKPYLTLLYWSPFASGNIAEADRYVPSDAKNITANGNITLYAHWQIEVDSVVNANGSTATSISVSQNSNVISQLPTKFQGAYAGATVDGNPFSVVNWDVQNAVKQGSGTITDISGVNSLNAGIYAVNGTISIDSASGYVWKEGVSAVTSITIYVEIIDDGEFYIVKIRNILDTTTLNSDYRLSSVIVEISQDKTATSGDSTYSLEAVWNSQIDTSFLGVHFVEGRVKNGSMQWGDNLLQSQKVSATINVIASVGEAVNSLKYKMYQAGTLPTSNYTPATALGYSFLCWTKNGVSSYGATDFGLASAGEYTAIYTKLSMQTGASIRLNKDYTGIRFMAYLDFYNDSFVGELLVNKANTNGNISVTMTFDYTVNGETHKIGGSTFYNMIYEKNTNDGSVRVSFSGVVSDILNYNEDGILNDAGSYAYVSFTPEAIVKLNGVEARKIVGTARSAKEVATLALAAATSSTYSASQLAVLNDYAK